MPHTELAFRPVHELAADVAARRLSPVDLIDAFLTRIEAQEPKLQAFVEATPRTRGKPREAPTR